MKNIEMKLSNMAFDRFSGIGEALKSDLLDKHSDLQNTYAEGFDSEMDSKLSETNFSRFSKVYDSLKAKLLNKHASMNSTYVSNIVSEELCDSDLELVAAAGQHTLKDNGMDGNEKY